MLFLEMVEYILQSGIIISIFLCLLLVKKKEKSTAEIILLFWIFASGYITFSYLLVYNGNYLNYPTLTVLGFGIPLLSGPFMYLYIKYQTKPLYFSKIDLLHFIPFVLSNLLFIQFYFLSFDSKIEFLKGQSSVFETENFLRFIATCVSGIVYILVCFFYLHSYRKRLKFEFSYLDSINFNWMLMLNIGLLLVWIIVIFIPDDRIIFSSSSIYLICLGFFGISQAQIFTERELFFVQSKSDLADSDNKEYLTETLLAKDESSNIQYFEEIYNKSIELIKVEKLYLNPELKVLDLAILLNVHPNLMSRAINQISGANFYDLINKMRVEEFIRRTRTEDSQKYTIMAMAFDSGFNSKATFYRNFKAIVGTLPSEFLKSNQGSRESNT
ncbi:AraC family transcriptional regulator [Algoriphagus lacus]|uniref:AraC family transcriptional regulator n=2 Tax=Algoriphagus lacus TaxID=2056311 RepID=A0A418PND1_9BACT|nr:AraC family transcriptional regulator [Algoriphagus lacus]